MAIFKKTQFLFVILFFSNAFSSKILQANFTPSNDSRLGLIFVVSWSAWVGYRMIDQSINKKLDFNSFDNYALSKKQPIKSAMGSILFPDLFPLAKKQPTSSVMLAKLFPDRFRNQTSLEARLARKRAEQKELIEKSNRFWFF